MNMLDRYTSAALALLLLALVTAALPCQVAQAGDDVPTSFTVISKGTVFPDTPATDKLPSVAMNQRPLTKARNEALAIARREALSVAAFESVPEGPDRQAFLQTRSWLERMENAYLEAVQIVSEETDPLGALTITIRASVRIADMMADAKTLAPRASLRNFPAVQIQVEAEEQHKKRLESLANDLRRDLAAKGVTNALPPGIPAPTKPLLLVLRAATPAETNGKGGSVAMELFGFRDERIQLNLCPDKGASLTANSCVAKFRESFTKNIYPLWERQVKGGYALTVRQYDIVSEDQGRTIAVCLGKALPGAAASTFLYYLAPVATYRLGYTAAAAYLDQDLHLKGVERLCGSYTVTRIEGENVVVESRHGR